MGERVIDQGSWRRRAHYAWFRALSFPYLAVTADVDVTDALDRAASDGISRFSALLHVLAEALNQVPELRQRIRTGPEDEVVVEHDLVHPAFTVDGGEGLFAYAMAEWTPDLPAFAERVARAGAEARAQPTLKPYDGTRDDVAYYSCLPWVRFTQVVHPVPLDRVDAVPRVAWGRLVQADGRWVCPVNLQAHHALVDGVHVGRFFQWLEGR